MKLDYILKSMELCNCYQYRDMVVIACALMNLDIVVYSVTTSVELCALSVFYALKLTDI